MELSWLMKLRIGAVVATGAILIGMLAWPLASPAERVGVVRVGVMSLSGEVTLVVLAFLAGFIAYFVSWPYGREIGVLAAPSGLAILAVRSGSMTALVQLHPTVSQRQALLETLKWEPIFWLAVVTAGFVGVLLGQKMRPTLKSHEGQEKPNSKPDKYLSAIVALVGSGFIAQFFIGMLAQDVRMFDNGIGAVVAQPAVGQIVFAVLVSFGLAAFAVKKFLDVSYVWPAIASAFVMAFAIRAYVNQVPGLVQRWPAAFFSNAVVSILPVQMVAFGTLGSIAGYWMAVRYRYWRKHEAK